MLPAFVDTDADGDEVLDASAYRAIASVLRAMRDHDEELGEVLDGLRRGLGARKQPRLPTDKVVLDVPATLTKDFIAAIHAQVIRLTTSSWEEGYAHLTAYVQANGSARVPFRYRTADGYWLGAWNNGQRTKKDTLSADRRQRLEAVDGWVWDARAAAWEDGFAHLTAYVEAEGSARVPGANYSTAGVYRLGRWVVMHRVKKGLDACGSPRAIGSVRRLGVERETLETRTKEAVGERVTHVTAGTENGEAIRTQQPGACHPPRRSRSVLKPQIVEESSENPRTPDG